MVAGKGRVGQSEGLAHDHNAIGAGPALNILLAARHEGFGGTITTLAVAQEPKLRELLGIPRHVAVCAIMLLGRPVKRLKKLKRKAVPEFTMLERWGGQPLTAATP